MAELRNLGRIGRAIGVDGIVGRLAERLPGTDLNSLLLEVMRAKTKQMSASELLKNYAANRFVHPAEIDPLKLKQTEIDTLTIASGQFYAPVQLSPVAPLGSCAVVASVDQNKVLSALRGTEVVADATNLLALHACHLIRTRQPGDDERPVRLCTTHRHVRTQFFGDSPGMLPHFHLFCMVSAGKDSGSYAFEIEAFREHVTVYREIFRRLFRSGIEVVLSRRKGYTDAAGLVARIVHSAPEGVEVAEGPANEDNPYYAGLQFTIRTVIAGQTIAIGDGGFVDWSRQLLGNKKERMLISAIGLDRLVEKTVAGFNLDV